MAMCGITGQKNAAPLVAVYLAHGDRKAVGAAQGLHIHRHGQGLERVGSARDHTVAGFFQGGDDADIALVEQIPFEPASIRPIGANDVGNRP